MKFAALCLLIVLCAWKNVTGQDVLEEGLDFIEEEVDSFVNTHNELRAAEFASNMLKMSWDENIASVAQQHAEGCVFEHSNAATRQTQDFPSLGENVYFAATSDPAGIQRSLVLQAMTDWYNEVSNYSFEFNTCDEGEQCGHYTQMVWASSYKLGCGAALCSHRIGQQIIVVCNYGPPGNFIGVRPFVVGEPCGNCGDSGDVCVSGLCANSIRGDDTEPMMSPPVIEITEPPEEIPEEPVTSPAPEAPETTPLQRETTEEIPPTPSAPTLKPPNTPPEPQTTRSQMMTETTAATFQMSVAETSKAATRRPKITTDFVSPSSTFSSPYSTTSYPTGQPTSTRAPPSECGSEDLKEWRESFRQWKMVHQLYVEKYLADEL